MSWKKFTACNSCPSSSTYPGLPDAIIWLRLFIGLTYGLSLGMREASDQKNIGGSIGIIFGMNVITFFPVLYLKYYLNANTESYKNLNFAGIPNALALMILVWTLFFTALHEKEEDLFNVAVTNSAVHSVTSDEVVADIVVSDEPEF